MSSSISQRWRWGQQRQQQQTRPDGPRQKPRFKPNNDWCCSAVCHLQGDGQELLPLLRLGHTPVQQWHTLVPRTHAVNTLSHCLILLTHTLTLMYACIQTLSKTGRWYRCQLDSMHAGNLIPFSHTLSRTSAHPTQLLTLSLTHRIFQNAPNNTTTLSWQFTQWTYQNLMQSDTVLCTSLLWQKLFQRVVNSAAMIITQAVECVAVELYFIK